MKKTYFAPKMRIVFVSQHLMQSASLGKNSNNIVSNNDDVLSRRDFDWDDDEE